MKTSSIKRVSGSQRAQCELEDTTSEAPTRDEGSTSAFVALIASNVILLLMLAA